MCRLRTPRASSLRVQKRKADAATNGGMAGRRPAPPSIYNTSLTAASLAVFFATSALAQSFHPEIPKAWDNKAVAGLELPLAQRDRSPRYMSAAEPVATFLLCIRTTNSLQRRASKYPTIFANRTTFWMSVLEPIPISRSKRAEAPDSTKSPRCEASGSGMLSAMKGKRRRSKNGSIRPA